MTFKCQSFHESRYRVFPLSMALEGGGEGNSTYFTSSGDIIYLCIVFYKNTSILFSYSTTS